MIFLDKGLWMERKDSSMTWDGFYSLQFVIASSFVPTYEPVQMLDALSDEENS